MKEGYKENIVLPGGEAECVKYSHTKESLQGPTSLPPSPAVLGQQDSPSSSQFLLQPSYPSIFLSCTVV